MASAREITVDETPMTPGQYAVQYNAFGSSGLGNYDPNNWLHRVGGFFTGDNKRFDEQYESYKNDFYRNKEIQDAERSEASARAFEEYMSNTAYQRAYEDLKKTGLNPRLLLSNAAGASTPSAQGVYSLSSSRSDSTSKTTSNSFSNSAVIAALLVLAGKLLLKK